MKSPNGPAAGTSVTSGKEDSRSAKPHLIASVPTLDGSSIWSIKPPPGLTNCRQSKEVFFQPCRNHERQQPPPSARFLDSASEIRYRYSSESRQAAAGNSVHCSVTPTFSSSLARSKFAFVIDIFPLSRMRLANFCSLEPELFLPLIYLLLVRVGGRRRGSQPWCCRFSDDHSLGPSTTPGCRQGET